MLGSAAHAFDGGGNGLDTPPKGPKFPKAERSGGSTGGGVGKSEGGAVGKSELSGGGTIGRTERGGDLIGPKAL